MRGNQARVKNADVRHPSSTVVMHRRKSASPVHNVLTGCNKEVECHKNLSLLVLLLYVKFLAAWTISEICTTYEKSWCFVSVRRTFSKLPCDLTFRRLMSTIVDVPHR